MQDEENRPPCLQPESAPDRGFAQQGPQFECRAWRRENAQPELLPQAAATRLRQPKAFRGVRSSASASVIIWIDATKRPAAHSLRDAPPSMGKIVSQDELILLIAREKRNGRRVVFTNGCFDLLHPGPVRCLAEGRAL